MAVLEKLQLWRLTQRVYVTAAVARRQRSSTGASAAAGTGAGPGASSLCRTGRCRQGPAGTRCCG